MIVLNYLILGYTYILVSIKKVINTILKKIYEE